MDLKNTIEIFTDGSFKRNRGAWAYVIAQDHKILREGVGKVKGSTCVRMELQAAIEALSTLPENSKVILYSDSRVLINIVTTWMHEWQQNGWTKKRNKPLPSADQIQVLFELNKRHTITWKWIKAHSGIEFNERCDQLCAVARGN